MKNQFIINYYSTLEEGVFIRPNMIIEYVENTIFLKTCFNDKYYQLNEIWVQITFP